MIILHVGHSERGLVLWGETPPDPSRRPAVRRGRKPKTPRPVPSPYDAGAEALATALREFGNVSDIDAARAVETVVWLPSIAGRPATCDALVAEATDPEAAFTLAPWTVAGFALNGDDWLNLLCACVDRQTLAPGVIVGYDLRFWSLALRVAGALVARQQFVPGLLERNDGFWARWTPLFLGADADRLTQLAKAMPPVCRALGAPGGPAPARPARDVLAAAIGDLVDQLVRSAPSRRPLPAPPPRRGRKTPAFESVHDAWLHALRSGDGRVAGDARDLAALARQVHEWQRPLTVTTAPPFRTCFRLEEPPDGPPSQEAGLSRAGGVRHPWRVTYLLQAADDPSLLVTVGEAWTHSRRKRSVLQRNGFNVREYLLVALGEASRLCAPIEDSLREANPSGCELGDEGAYEFLSVGAPALQQAGFGVMLPAWWTGKGTKLRLSARAKVSSPAEQLPGRLSLDTLVNFDWEVALGTEKLTLRELEALAKLKAPLVRVRGQWVHISHEEIQAALEFWRKRGAQSATVRDVVRLALGAERAPGDLPIEGVSATGWVGDLLSLLEGGAAYGLLAQPEGFIGTLRPYQARGYSWLAWLRHWGFGACLADDMGLGKTVQALALIQRDWVSNGKRPVLLICPTSVVGNWQKEAARFAPDLPVMVQHGITRSKGEAFVETAERHALVVSSYALMHRDLPHLQRVAWAGVVLDEAQNIKNASTKQAQAARSLAADYRVALTGTPVENNVGDLWSIMEFLNPGFLGSRNAFRESFLIPIQAHRDPGAADRLKRLTGPFLLRRLKTDRSIISDLPEKMEMNVYCTLTKEQASLYAAVIRDLSEGLERAEGMERRGLVLATLAKLKQVCNHPAHFLGDNSAIPGRSGKLSRLTEMIDEVLAGGEGALIFSQFTEMGGILVRHLQESFGQEVIFLHGGCSKKQRDHMVERFQSDAGPQLFVLSLKAGGTGLNLTRANHVFHFDRWWNPAVENQATDRAFRIGQTKRVQVHKYVCAGTVEEKIDEMIQQKRTVAEQVVGTGEAWLTELSTAELKELFTLRESAVAE